MKVNMHRVLALAIILFCISSLTYAFWPPINRVLALFIIAALVSCFLTNIRQKDVIIGLGLIGVLFFSIVVAEDMAQNLEDWLYWAVTCVFLVLMGRESFAIGLTNELRSFRRLTDIIIYASNLLLAVSFFVPSSYAQSAVGVYYLGFGYSSHTICCGASILLALTLFRYQNENSALKQTLLMIPATLAILESGARTFLVSAVVFWAVYFIYVLKSKKMKILAFPVMVAVALIAIMNSGLMEKFVATSSNQYISEDALTAMSSGRLEFWQIDLEAFAALDWICKIVGKGFDYVYEVNATQYGLRIWAHNDIINILLSAGVIGFLVYTFVFVEVRKWMKESVSKRSSRMLLWLYVLVPLLVNGLFLYQHYLYSFILLALFFANREHSEKTANL